MKTDGYFATFHEDVFIRHFGPCIPKCVTNNDVYGNFALQPDRKIFEVIKKECGEEYVWTIIDDGGVTRNIYYATGFHFVNKEGYVVTKKPHDFLPIEFCYYWHRPFLSDAGLQRELTKLRRFIAAHRNVNC